MAFSLLWSLGLIVSIIIFSAAIAVTLSYNDISRKVLVEFCLVSIVSTFALTYAIGLFKVQLNSIFGSYNYLLLFLIALILMFTGYLINKERDFKDNFMKILLLSYVCFILAVLVCVGSKEPLFGLDALQIGILTAVLFNLLVAGIFFISKRLKLGNASYKNLGSMYVIGGIYFLIVALFLPNIVALNMDDMRPINIVSIESLAITVILLIVVVVLGSVYYKKNSLLK
jgi:predicted transporter